MTAAARALALGTWGFGDLVAAFSFAGEATTVILTGDPPKLVVSIKTRCGLPLHAGTAPGAKAGLYSSPAMPALRNRWLFVLLLDPSVAQNCPVLMTVPDAASTFPVVGPTA